MSTQSGLRSKQFPNPPKSPKLLLVVGRQVSDMLSSRSSFLCGARPRRGGASSHRIAASVLAMAWALSAHLPATAQDYRIGPRDVVQVHVYNQPDLSGLYTVEADGTISFPLIGRIAAGDLTLPAFERALRERLAAGYFRNPRVSVAVAEYHSRRVFIIGEVRQPGAYPLTGEVSVIELLALAGGTTPLASGEAVAARAGESSEGPVLPDDGEAVETVRVNLEALAEGDLSHNLTLRHGDTVFVPRADVVYVLGEVRNPGQYPIRNDTSVLQALSLAGGGTEFAALNRVRVVRTVDGEQFEFRVQLGDVVRPDDIIRVPQRFF